MKKEERILERFADAQHDIWSHWMEYMFSVSTKLKDGSYNIDKEKAKRWIKQMETDYNDLSEKEKESDREIVKQYLSHIIDEIKK